MRSNIGSLISYHTLEGCWPSYAQFEQLISQFKLQDVVVVAASILACVESWRTIKSDEADRRVREHVFGTFSSRFLPFRGGFVFSRFSILWLLRQAFTICPDAGVEIDTSDSLRSFGIACLMANSLATNAEHIDLKTDLELATYFMPITDYASVEEYDREIARTQYLLSEFAASGSIEIGERLEELLGFTFAEYRDMALGIAGKLMGSFVANPSLYVTPAIRPSDFQTTTIPVNRAGLFLESVSASYEKFKIHLRAIPAQTSDLTVFRNWPLLRLDSGDYIALDTGLILDKAGRSFFWSGMYQCSDPRERKTLLGRWGELFEQYVNRILMDTVGPNRKVITNPRFENGDQALDCCVLEGSTLVAIETKSSTLSNRAKYSGQVEHLRDEIEKKFVVGDDSGRKGVSQIALFLRRFTGGERVLFGHGESLSCSVIKKIVPALVHLDSSLRTLRLNHYLADRLRDFGRNKKPIITPLALVSASELEELQGSLSEFLLSDILESYLRTLRTNREAVFHTNKVPLLSGKERRPGAIVRTFDAMIESLNQRLFP